MKPLKISGKRQLAEKWTRTRTVGHSSFFIERATD